VPLHEASKVHSARSVLVKVSGIKVTQRVFVDGRKIHDRRAKTISRLALFVAAANGAHRRRIMMGCSVCHNLVALFCFFDV
jgi:hypothetical protein